LSDALSILDAAREAPDALALWDDGAALTFAQLAQRVRERWRGLEPQAVAGIPFPVDGTGAVETLVTLYALLEARVPALLVDPRLTLPEREALLETARRLGPVRFPDTAAILFTSGTTGTPRGAVLTRSALLASAAASAANLGWRDDDRWLLCMPVARVGGLSIVTRCLAARRALARVPAFDATCLPAWIAASRATLVSVVPTMLARWLDAHPDWVPPAHLRAVLVGGAEAPAALLARAARLRLPIVLTYGMTETCSQVVATSYAARFAPASERAGRPLGGVALRLRDGHIEIKGPMRMAGYWDGPPLSPDEWFDTGDLGELDTRGCLTVQARRVDLILTGGENVYPAEVEKAIEAFPGIARAAVFGVPDATWGQTVAAAIVASPDVSRQALAEFLAARLAPWKRPRSICVVADLPATTAGKLDRGALAGFASALEPLRSPEGT
jgi:O-succinylbenzoic acid--CoA ligase